MKKQTKREIRVTMNGESKRFLDVIKSLTFVKKQLERGEDNHRYKFTIYLSVKE